MFEHQITTHLKPLLPNAYGSMKYANRIDINRHSLYIFKL